MQAKINQSETEIKSFVKTQIEESSKLASDQIEDIQQSVDKKIFQSKTDVGQ